MTTINILEQQATDNGWQFTVHLEDEAEQQEHLVTLDRDYYEKVTDGAVSADRLVEAAFRFLLDHEPKEQILSHFTLDTIQNYFPEFEQEVVKIW
jgi:CHASE3 domain sensor protein